MSARSAHQFIPPQMECGLCERTLRETPNAFTAGSVRASRLHSIAIGASSLPVSIRNPQDPASTLVYRKICVAAPPSRARFTIPSQPGESEMQSNRSTMINDRDLLIVSAVLSLSRRLFSLVFLQALSIATSSERVRNRFVCKLLAPVAVSSVFLLRRHSLLLHFFSARFLLRSFVRFALQ